MTLPGMSGMMGTGNTFATNLTPVFSTSASVICPTVSNKDIAIFAQWSANTSSIPALVVPTGFTNVCNTFTAAFTDEFRMAASYKLLDGTEGGTSLSGMTGAANRATTLLVIRLSQPPISVNSAFDGNAQMTDGDPTLQTLDAGVTPRVVLLWGFQRSDIAGGTATGTLVSNATKVTTSSNIAMYYEVQSSHVSRTFDAADDGNKNFLMSFGLELNV